MTPSLHNFVGIHDLWVKVSLWVSNSVPLQAVHQPNAANVINASEPMLQRYMKLSVTS